jgi:hypothetical protein
VLLCCFISAFFFRLSNTNIIVGFFLLAIGCFLHIVAKGILIRNVVLCDEGIYGIVRHPYYLANYVIDTSFCVLSTNPYLLLLYPFLFFWAYGPTLRKEEKYLATQHGEAFMNDSFEIPQVFPDSGSRNGWRRIFEGFSVKRITVKEYSRIAQFLSMSFVILLVHGLKPGGLEGLRHLLLPTKHDYDKFVFLLLAGTLLGISVVLSRIARSKRNKEIHAS